MSVITRCVVCGMVLLVAAVAGAQEPVGNNLSYPAVYTSGGAGTFGWYPPDLAIFLDHFSYGCDVPETVDQYSYPNTSCVLDDEVTYLSPEECVASDGPCFPLAVDDLDLIYWQKLEDLTWEADTIVMVPPVAASYLDWSDNLESNTWAVTSVIRIETQPFYQHPDYEPLNSQWCDDYPDLCMTGFQMWHASGHGPTEHWGVRVAPDVAQPFVYESPFAIIHTSAARLNIAKLEKADKQCPSPSGTPSDPPPDTSTLVWNTVQDDTGRILYGYWTNTDGDDPCELEDLEQTVELNVGGKWTYGYNWMTKRMDFDDCEAADYEQEGWWRLTFYTEDGSVDFGTDSGYWVGDKLAAPPLPEAAPQTESDTGDTLYAPEVLTEHNLTYIDICLANKGGGGGGGGGGKGPPW